MKQKILILGFICLIIVDSCSNKNQEKKYTLDTTTGKPRPPKSSEKALWALLSYQGIGDVYIHAWINTYKNNSFDSINHQDALYFDSIYNQTCKARDSVKSVGDELDSNDYRQFNFLQITIENERKKVGEHTERGKR